MVEDHRHCIVCGKPTAPDVFFCSPSCEEIFKRGQRRAIRYRNLTLILFVVILVMFVAAYIIRAGP